MSTHPGPLAGIRVFDLTSVIMGPLATQILGDLGADVITAETVALSRNRLMSAGAVPGLSGLSMNLLRNKRSIIIDLATPAGRDVATRIAVQCDVFVSNLRQRSLQRLGLGYDALRSRRPDIVYCQAQGYPAGSQSADEPAYDDVIQAATGMADLALRVHGTPQLAPTLIADKVAGMVIAQSVLAALVQRERTGEGARIEVAMTDALTSFMLVEHAAAATTRPALGPPGYQRILTSERRPAPTSDGWIHVLPYNIENYTALFRAGGKEHLADDRIVSFPARVKHADSLYRDVREILATRTTAEWLSFCRDHEIPAVELMSLDELIERLPDAHHPRAGTYKALRPFAVWNENADYAVRPAPLQGEQTIEILEEFGMAANDVAALLADGVVRSEPMMP